MNLKSRRHQRCPQWFRGRDRRLLSKRRELLGLIGQYRKLVLYLLSRKLDELRRRLYARDPLGKVEGGLGVGVSNLKQLVIVILHPFNCRRIAMLHNVGRLPGGRAHFLKNFPWIVRLLFRPFRVTVPVRLSLISPWDLFPSEISSVAALSWRSHLDAIGTSRGS